MAECPKCRAPLAVGAPECPKCGLILSKWKADAAGAAHPFAAPAVEPAPVATVSDTKKCPFCAEEIKTEAIVCKHCGRDLRPSPPPRPIGQDPVMRALLPVGRSGWAIAAGYLGLFSLLLVPAPLAVLTGILAVADMKKHPEKHGMGRAVFGIVLGLLGTIGLAFVVGSR